MTKLSDLNVKLFADGANLAEIARHAESPWIQGFTTNPTLMCKAGIRDYRAFARDVLSIVPDRPVSFEVFTDDFREMERQALEVASWGSNVSVKIPVTNTLGRFTGPIIRKLTRAGVQINVTAVLTTRQVKRIADCLDFGTHSYVSVFAGRIADTGVDPVPLMTECVRLLQHLPKVELIWASPRELLNVFQAEDVGCHILTATNELLAKLNLIGKNLDEYSLETVKMFHRDAMSAGFSIPATASNCSFAP